MEAQKICLNCVGIKHIILVRLSINGEVICVEKGEGRKESEDAVCSEYLYLGMERGEWAVGLPG